MINYENILHQADVNTLTCCYANIHLAVFHKQTMLTKSNRNILVLFVFLLRLPPHSRRQGDFNVSVPSMRLIYIRCVS